MPQLTTHLQPWTCQACRGQPWRLHGAQRARQSLQRVPLE